MNPGQQLDHAVANALATKGTLLGDIKTRAFSTDWNDAMWAAEKVGLFTTQKEFKMGVNTYIDWPPKWAVASLDECSEFHDFTEATTGPHAICLAIIKLATKQDKHT